MCFAVWTIASGLELCNPSCRQLPMISTPRAYLVSPPLSCSSSLGEEGTRRAVMGLIRIQWKLGHVTRTRGTSYGTRASAPQMRGTS